MKYDKLIPMVYPCGRPKLKFCIHGLNFQDLFTCRRNILCLRKTRSHNCTKHQEQDVNLVIIC